jgi:hypothetical protein
MLSVINAVSCKPLMLSVVILNVVMLRVVMLSDLAPTKLTDYIVS